MKIRIAFSLVELLISLLIISVIVGVMAPVITKKFKNNLVIKRGDDVNGSITYPNPGTYSFEVPKGVRKLFISGSGGGGGGAGAYYETKKIYLTRKDEKWTVPVGVNQVDIKITGSGGGGGGAYLEMQFGDDTNPGYCYNNEFLAIRGGVDEQDLCITDYNLTFVSTGCGSTPGSRYYGFRSTINEPSVNNKITDWSIEPAGWNWYLWQGSNWTNAASYPNKAPGYARYVATYGAAKVICDAYGGQLKGTCWDDLGHGKYRLPKKEEAQKIITFFEKWVRRPVDASNGKGIDLCTANYVSRMDGYENPSFTPVCKGYNNCQGSSMGCIPYQVWLDGNETLVYDNNNSIFIGNGEYMDTASVRCVRPRFIHKKRHTGAGGASGAQLQRSAVVNPGDVFYVEAFGYGGAGGMSGPAAASGGQGGPTSILQMRNGAVIHQYGVYGAHGGWAGADFDNGYAFNNEQMLNVNKNGYCVDNHSLVECSIYSNSGEAGTDNAGGNGAKFANSGYFARGGYNFIAPLVFYNGNGIKNTTDARFRDFNQYFTAEEFNAAFAQDATNVGCGGGGGFVPKWYFDGINLNGDTRYFRGGNGGSAKIEITYKIVHPGAGGGAAADARDIEYNVTPGSKIIFTVGKGGDGGAVAMNGYNGGDTVVMSDHIVFGSGKGAVAASSSNLNSTSGSGGILKKKSVAQGGSGGNGNNGEYPMIKDASGKFINNGFDGGVGGKTFLGYFGGCGGGMIGDNNAARNCRQYDKNGAPGTQYDALSDKNGGAGGGGGGLYGADSALGSGAKGADGYLRIRWGD